MAMYTTANDVKRAFVRNGLPFFLIKGKGGDTLWYNGQVEDVEEAAEMMHEFCTNLQDTNEIKIYQFPNVPKAGITKAKPEDGVLITYQNKRIYTNDEKVEYWRNKAIGLGGQQQTDPALIALLTEMREDIKANRSEMAEIRKLQMELDEAEDDDEVRDQSQLGLVGMLNNPGIQNLLLNFFSNLGANAATNQMNQRPQGMAGVGDDAELVKYVEQLLAKGVTVEHLKKLSEMPTVKIKSLLMML